MSNNDALLQFIGIEPTAWREQTTPTTSKKDLLTKAIQRLERLAHSSDTPRTEKSGFIDEQLLIARKLENTPEDSKLDDAIATLAMHPEVVEILADYAQSTDIEILAPQRIERGLLKVLSQRNNAAALKKFLRNYKKELNTLMASQADPSTKGQTILQHLLFERITVGYHNNASLIKEISYSPSYVAHLMRHTLRDGKIGHLSAKEELFYFLKQKNFDEFLQIITFYNQAAFYKENEQKETFSNVFDLGFRESHDNLASFKTFTSNLSKLLQNGILSRPSLSIQVDILLLLSHQPQVFDTDFDFAQLGIELTEPLFVEYLSKYTYDNPSLFIAMINRVSLDNAAQIFSNPAVKNKLLDVLKSRFDSIKIQNYTFLNYLTPKERATAVTDALMCKNQKLAKTILESEKKIDFSETCIVFDPYIPSDLDDRTLAKLLEIGMDANKILFQRQNYQPESIAFNFASHFQFKHIQLLVDNGLNVNAIGISGNHLFFEVLKALFTHLQTVSMTPFEEHQQCLRLIKSLKEKKADIKCNPLYINPLLFAASIPSGMMFELFLSISSAQTHQDFLTYFIQKELNFSYASGFSKLNILLEKQRFVIPDTPGLRPGHHTAQYFTLLREAKRILVTEIGQSTADTTDLAEQLKTAINAFLPTTLPVEFDLRYHKLIVDLLTRLFKMHKSPDIQMAFTKIIVKLNRPESQMDSREFFLTPREIKIISFRKGEFTLRSLCVLKLQQGPVLQFTAPLPAHIKEEIENKTALTQPDTVHDPDHVDEFTHPLYSRVEVAVLEEATNILTENNSQPTFNAGILTFPEPALRPDQPPVQATALSTYDKFFIAIGIATGLVLTSAIIFLVVDFSNDWEVLEGAATKSLHTFAQDNFSSALKCR